MINKLTKIFSRAILIVLELFLLFCIGSSQEQNNGLQHYKDSADVAIARIDLAVPEAPAIKILDVETDMIMRPGTVREIGVSVSDFLRSGGAIELSPGLLLGNTTLNEYQKNPFLYRARISAATKSPSDGGRDYAWGLRFTLVDETDLRTDQMLQDTLVSIAHETEKKVFDITRERGIDPFDEKGKAELARISDSCIALGLDEKIASVREKAKARNWNKSILELGIAGVATSMDSTFKHLMQNKYGLWLTGGFPLLGEKGQIVIGLKALLRRSQENKLDQGSGSMALRSYIGSNRLKGFLEADWTAVKNELPIFGLNAGGEFNVINGIWIDLSVGVSKKKYQYATLTSSFNIRLATPELTQ